MRTSDIVQLRRDLTSAISAAGRGEFGWYLLLEKLDELGYDLIRREATEAPPAVTAGPDPLYEAYATNGASLLA